MSDPTVVLRRAVDVHKALARAGIDSAIGGALALAYHVSESRSTQDIDVNISLPKERSEQALAALPDEVPWTERHLDVIRRDGQVRIMWPVRSPPPMPLDLFFAEHRFHGVAATRTIVVPLLDADVQILSATDLTVFKALYDRPKDWVDIGEMAAYGPPSLDLDDAVGWVGEIVGEDDVRTRRLRSLTAG